VVEAILTATREELAKVALDGLRIEAVAARAGVNKSTIYRRWPTVEALALEAVQACPFFLRALPERGRLAKDLEELVEASIDGMEGTAGQMMARWMLTGVGHSPPVDNMARSLRASFLGPWLSVLQNAKARGELPAEIDEVFVGRLLASCVLTGVMLGEHLDHPRWPAELVAAWMQGVCQPR
jgi:AcrR family transcriptional regulator